MADDNQKKVYEAAMKNLEALIKKQQSLNKTTEAMKNSWSAISAEVFKMDGANWYKKIPLAAEDLKKLNDQMKDIEQELNQVEKAFDSALSNDDNFKKLTNQSITFFSEYKNKIDGLDKSSNDYYEKRKEAEEEYLSQMRANFKGLSSLSDEQLRSITDQLGKGKDLTDIYSKLDEESQNLLITLSDSAEEMLEMKRTANELEGAFEGVNNKIKTGEREVFSLGRGLKNWAQVITKEGIASLMEFDKVLNNIQKNTGIAMDENATNFANMTTRVAQFGMNAEKAGEMMSLMSDELDTTNFSILSKTAEDFAAIEGATGASAEEISKIGGQLMRMGQSSSDVKDYMEDASKMAKSFGVNSKKAMADISRNISKMRSMGFVGGEESLKSMVITAQKLNQNIDEVFDVASKARNIEGAMDMASQLQLAGGSFSNINPMDLLAAARNGPKELQRILTQMGSDIGRFNEKTGQVEFDAVDKDRLQIAADATGQTLENMMNGIQKGAQDAKKLQPFQGMLDNLDTADKALAESSLSDMMKWDEKSGKFVIDADNDLAKKMGITSLEQITDTELKNMLQKKKDDEKTLEEQNKRNQSFKEALTNFYGALTSIFSVFQPVLSVLTTVMQTLSGWIAQLPGWSKYLLAGLLLFSTTFGASVLTFVGKGLVGLKNIFTGKAGILGKLRGIIPGGEEGGGARGSTSDFASKAEGPKSGVGEGLKSLAEGLGALGTTEGVFKGILAVALAGPAFLLFVPALPGLMVLALIGKMGESVADGFKAVAEGLGAFGTVSGVLKGIGAVALAAVPLLILTTALPGLLMMGLIGNMAESVTAGFKSVAEGLGAFGNEKSIFTGIGAVALAGVALAVFTLAIPALLGIALLGVMSVPIGLGFSAISNGIGMMGKNLGDILKGSLALIVVGAAMLPFAFAASMMSDIDWLNVLAGVGTMALVMLALVGIGLTAMFLGPLLLAGAAMMAVAGVAMMVAGAGMMVMANAFQALQGIDGGALVSVAMGMMALGPAMLFMSFGMMAFANPLALFGMFMMVQALTSLSSVMTPLASSLTIGAQGLNNFASGLEKLSAAADSLSDEKLAKLQKISEAMAKASASSNALSATANAANNAQEGGKGGAGGTRKIEIDIKMNGRELQNFIRKDTAIIK